MSNDADRNMPAGTPLARASGLAAAHFAMVVIIATGPLVVLIRLVTGSWLAGGLVGAVAGGVSVVVYPWLFRRARA